MSETGKMRDNLQLVGTLLEGLKLPAGIKMVEADLPLFLVTGSDGTHRAEYVVYLFKPVAENDPKTKLYVRAVRLGFLQFAKAETSDGLEWALTLVREVEDAAKLLELEIERGEAQMIEDGGELPRFD